MLNINIISGTKKSMAAILFVFAAVANSNVAGASINETCAFVKQLEDPVESYNFRHQLYAAQRSSSYYAEKTVTIAKDGETYEVDTFSFNCLSCHDGSTSPAHDIGFKNAGNNGNYDGSGLKSHPIGMHYGSATYINDQLQRLENLNPNMVLIDGRVGCLTCHNPLNRKVPHLVTSNEHSNLCLTCHIK